MIRHLNCSNPLGSMLLCMGSCTAVQQGRRPLVGRLAAEAEDQTHASLCTSLKSSLGQAPKQVAHFLAAGVRTMQVIDQSDGSDI